MSQSKKTLLFAGFFGGLLYVIYAYWLSPVPPDWTTYTNLKGLHYSFAHPKDWIVSECGNGEVVVTKKPIEECIEPLDATKGYLENIYFQVFLPQNNMLIREQDFDKINIPSHLANWKMKFWEENDYKILGNYHRVSSDNMPYKQSRTISNDVDLEKITYSMSWFSVGFVSDTTQNITFKKVLQSIRLYPPMR